MSKIASTRTRNECFALASACSEGALWIMSEMELLPMGRFIFLTVRRSSFNCLRRFSRMRSSRTRNHSGKNDEERRGRSSSCGALGLAASWSLSSCPEAGRAEQVSHTLNFESVRCYSIARMGTRAATVLLEPGLLSTTLFCVAVCFLL